MNKRYRRQRYYYQIHLVGARIVDGKALWNGMLEAEREVERKSAELAAQTGRKLHAYMIVREPRRRRTIGVMG